LNKSKKHYSEQEIENFFAQNNKYKSISFDKAFAKCIQKKLPLSLTNLFFEYQQIIEIANAKKFKRV
jgi:hypothetical protein